MNNEYWNMVLLGKPRIGFYLTVVLFIATGVFLLLDWKSGRVVAMTAMGFAVWGWLGWTRLLVPDNDFPEIQKRRRPIFTYMIVLLAVPVISLWLEKRPESKSHPEDSAKSLFATIWNDGKEIFGKEPPLDVRLDHRSEYLGLEKVDFLIITNKSGEGVKPITGTLHGAKTTFPISLPPVLKPYETVEVRLQNQNRKWFVEKGESLTIECEGYSKPFKLTRQ